MSNNRIQALKSMNKTDLEIIFIDKNNLDKWIVPEYPLHEAYPFLSAIHRADYLRVYFMHHYGGGYSDIKKIRESWLPSYNKLVNSDKWGIGYQEVGIKGVAMVRSIEYFKLLINWKNLLGNCSYIFKPKTDFTFEWLNLTEKCLDEKLEKLIKFPATHPEDYYRKEINYTKSKYPLLWSELLGNIFHPLCFKHSKKLLNGLPTPILNENYD